MWMLLVAMLGHALAKAVEYHANESNRVCQMEEANNPMNVSVLLQRFMKHSPIPVMARALMERVLAPQRLNACFDRVVKGQYTRDLLFSSIFELMSLVVLKIFPSIHAAVQANKADIGVSMTAVYDKLNGLETAVPEALVQETAQELGELVTQLGGKRQALLPGYKVKMLDGNCLASTQHRLQVLRPKAAGALPGKSLVVYDPELEIVTHVFPCEDGHRQERALLWRVQECMQANDVYVQDRNFCVREHFRKTIQKGAYFVCRHHQQVAYEPLGKRRLVGKTDTGTVYEQCVKVSLDDGETLLLRCITVVLKQASRDGDQEIVILSNLPQEAADAIKIAQLYRHRWKIETVFQEVEAHLNSEIDTLGYPKAALFGFCVAVIAYNMLALIKAALRKVHGEEKIANEVSGYYIAGEINRTHEGMIIALEPSEWAVFRTMTVQMFVTTILQLACNVDLKKYKKHPRGQKIKAAPRTSSKNEPHVSTAKLLLAAASSP